MKEIINWTLRQPTSAQGRDSVSVVREILSNYGMTLPNGTALEILQTMMKNDYMGWKNCTYAQAQELADSGETVVGVNSEKAVLLTAEETDSSYNTESSEYVTTVSALSTQTLSGMQFFSTNSTGTTTTEKPNSLKLILSGIPKNGKMVVGQTIALEAYMTGARPVQLWIIVRIAHGNMIQMYLT